MSFISVTHSQKKNQTKKLKRWLIIVSIAVLSIIATLIILVAMSLGEANRLMRQKPTELITFASNLMPSREITIFSSADDQTKLSGWFFATPQAKVNGTIIINGNKDSTRLPYDLETPAMLRQMTQAGFNVLSYDVRRNGESVSEMHTYGYAEALDVIGAMDWVIRRTGDERILLMGIGSGVTATLFATEYLQKPLESLRKKSDSTDKEKQTSLKKPVIVGLILDSPLNEAADYIRRDLPNQGAIKNAIYSSLVPYAVRMTVGNTQNTSLVTLSSSNSVPTLIYGTADILKNHLCLERQRLHKDTTTLIPISGNTVGRSFVVEPKQANESLKVFLTKWYPQSTD